MATPDDYEVQCPYVRSHMIRRSRIQQHLVKCERNFPGLVMEWCPHNASHRFAHHKDFVAHVPNCPDARISSNVLIMMSMKYHESGDVCKVNFDPEKQPNCTEDWALEYAESSGNEEPLSSSSGENEADERGQDISNNSSRRSSCESVDGDIDNISKEVASIDIDNGVSVLAQITPYSLQTSTGTTVKMRSEGAPQPVLKTTHSAIEHHYLRGISIGRGHKLPWLDGKPGKAAYQKTTEHQELGSGDVQKSIGRGFSLRSPLSRNPGHGLRKPTSSCH